MENICVFASSSNSVAQVYKKAARQLGAEIAKKEIGIVFGAGTDGLMGELARASHQHSGYVTGVIPDSLNMPGIVYEKCDELVDTRTMAQRKAIMEQKSFAFIALPGGFGTLEEILEIITLKQLGYHNKPVVIINTSGFYDNLVAQLNEIVRQDFAVSDVLTLFYVCQDAKQLLITYYRTDQGPALKSTTGSKNFCNTDIIFS